MTEGSSSASDKKKYVYSCSEVNMMDKAMLGVMMTAMLWKMMKPSTQTLDAVGYECAYSAVLANQQMPP